MILYSVFILLREIKKIIRIKALWSVSKRAELHNRVIGHFYILILLLLLEKPSEGVSSPPK